MSVCIFYEALFSFVGSCCSKTPRTNGGSAQESAPGSSGQGTRKVSPNGGEKKGPRIGGLGEEGSTQKKEPGQCHKDQMHPVIMVIMCQMKSFLIMMPTILKRN